MTKIILLAAIAPLFPLAAAYADHPEHHKPPQAAIDACANAKRADACSFTHDGHAISGTCEAPPDVTTLACRPDHPPGPPPEAIAACNSLKVGDTCSFAHGSDEVPGTCSKGPDGNGPLACKPEHPPHDRGHDRDHHDQ